MKLIIDGDMFLYRASFSTEVEIKWDEDTWTLHSSEKESQHSFDSCLMGVVNKLDKDAAFILAFSDTENYRYDIFPNYKSNRRNTRKPLGLKALREWAIES
jgi:DNA polymerase-1